MRLRWLCIPVVLLYSIVIFAQAPADRGKATTSIGGKEVTIDYGRPVLKGRSFEELAKKLPADRMWRAGSGAVTTLNTAGSIVIGGKKIPAGKYSLYVTCPEQGDYSLVVNKDLGQPLVKIFPQAPANIANDPYPHFDYTKEIASQEVTRVPMKKVTGAAVDVFTIDFKPAGKGATMVMSWGENIWSVDIAPGK